MGVRKIIRNILNTYGYEIIKLEEQGVPTDILADKEFMALYLSCKPYTMTSVERMYTLYLSVLHVLDNNLEGDFVECGVWRGGSSMLMAKCLQLRGRTDKKIYLYDTFGGMTKPEDVDVSTRTNQVAMEKFEETSTSEDSADWCYASLDEVQQNMYATGIDPSNLQFVKGKVEETIPQTMPEKIALLRLDTDWYKSTKHELEHMYPILVKDGILIIDDFGHWDGCKKAVIEYFADRPETALINRIDVAGRMIIKNLN